MGGLTDVIESAEGLAKIVGAVAPTVADALGSPLAGVAITLLGHAFGCSTGKIDDVVSAIAADPNANDKLRVLEEQNKPILAQLASQNYAIEVGDREDARRNSPQYKDFLRHMAYLVTCGFFGVLIIMFLPFSINPDSTERELLSMLVGMLVSKWQTIIDFYYGSSSKQGGLQ